MICPYNRKMERQVVQWTQNYDEDLTDRISDGETVTTTTFAMMECKQEECGAWYQGRCCYAAVNLENQ